MQSKAQSHNSIFGIAWNSALAIMLVLLVLIVVILFIVFIAQPAQGQTYRVIHNFTGGRHAGEAAIIVFLGNDLPAFMALSYTANYQ